MRTFLRAIAAFQVWVAVGGFFGAVGVYVYRGSVGASWPPGDGVLLCVAFALLLTLTGGGLWCLAGAPPRPRLVFQRWRPLRWVLLSLAVVQLGIGLALTLAAGEYEYEQLLSGRWRRTNDPYSARLVVPAALGLACVGGVLWCVTQSAYPARHLVLPELLPDARPERGFAAATTRAVKMLTAAFATTGVLIVAAVGTNPLLAPNAIVTLFLVVVGGTLWCLNRIALTPATPVAPGSPVARHGLRLLAATQIVLGFGLGVMAAQVVAPRLAAGSWPRGDSLVALGLLPGAVGLACVGGVLWCVARVAYPARPPDEALPLAVEVAEPEPGRGSSPMWSQLRGLAGAVVGASCVMAVGSAALAGYSYTAAGGRFGAAAPWVAVAPVFAPLAAVGHFLFHLAGALIPRPPEGPPARNPARTALRLVAIAQMGIGGLTAVAALLVGGGWVLLGSATNPWAAILAAVVGFVAVGVTCLGGLLWCAVRLAYPDGWDET